MGVFGYGGAFGVAGLVNDPGSAGPPSPSATFRGLAGVYGEARGDKQTGVLGYSTGAAYQGVSGAGFGNSLAGVFATAEKGYGILAGSNGGKGIAGHFDSDVAVIGTLSKKMGGFRIDHPLHPEESYLQHSFVESPDMMNVYAGTAVLDGNGEAEIKLPEWFEALNKEFRYQITCIGKFAPVFVSRELADNRFAISGGAPGIKVCWQVTGVRHDSYADQHRLPVEIDKATVARAAPGGVHPEKVHELMLKVMIPQD